MIICVNYKNIVPKFYCAEVVKVENVYDFFIDYVLLAVFQFHPNIVAHHHPLLTIVLIATTKR
jgi:hypothetical protein